jgi:BirA family biotin operon repressor/biotin-[acetyl-CoA-carboxylase] ligase
MSEPQVHRYARVGSTLDVLHELASRGAVHGTVVVALEQLEGRGTRGRTWHSPPGGLWYSMLLRTIPDATVDSLSLRIGLVVCQVLEGMIPGLRLGLKWPNDIMLGEKKLGGVLCEARWHGPELGWIAVGIGLNVANDIPEGLGLGAINLGALPGNVSAEALIEPLTVRLRGLDLSGSGLTPDELAEFQGRDWLRGRRLASPVPGIARGIRPDGMLEIERSDGTTMPVRAGHLQLG